MMKASRKGRYGRKGGSEFRSFFGETVDQSLDAVFEMDLSEVDEQSKALATQPEWRQHLFGVDGVQCFDGLQVHDHQVGNQQVGAKPFIEAQLFETNGNRNLPLNTKAKSAQFVGKHDFINRFEQTRPKSRVNFKRHVKHSLRNFVFTNNTERRTAMHQLSIQTFASSASFARGN